MNQTKGWRYNREEERTLSRPQALSAVWRQVLTWADVPLECWNKKKTFRPASLDSHYPPLSFTNVGLNLHNPFCNYDLMHLFISFPFLAPKVILFVSSEVRREKCEPRWKALIDVSMKYKWTDQHCFGPQRDWKKTFRTVSCYSTRKTGSKWVPLDLIKILHEAKSHTDNISHEPTLKSYTSDLRLQLLSVLPQCFLIIIH